MQGSSKASLTRGQGDKLRTSDVGGAAGGEGFTPRAMKKMHNVMTHRHRRAQPPPKELHTRVLRQGKCSGGAGFGQSELGARVQPLLFRSVSEIAPARGGDLLGRRSETG